MKDYVYKLHKELKTAGFNVMPIKEVIIESKTTSYFGKCKKHIDGTCTIYITKECIAAGAAKNTILHELCHAIKGSRHHDHIWKSAAAKVSKLYGVNIQTRVNTEISSKTADKHKYVIKCLDCGCKMGYDRMCKTIKEIKAGSKDYICPKCKGNNLEVC